MTVPDDNIRILSYVDGTYPVLYSKLPRRVHRDGFQCFLFRHIAVLDQLCSVYVQPARAFVGVRVDRNIYTRMHHDRRVIGNRIVGLDLISPTIGKNGGARTMRGDLFGYFVALQRMLEGPDLKSEFVRQTDQHQDLVRPVAM